MSARIPAALQDVFVASNMGKEVHKPPSEGEACKVYVRNWVNNANNSNSCLPPKNRMNANSSLLGESMSKVETFQRNVPLAPVDEDGTPSHRRKRRSFKERAKVLPQTVLDEQMKERGYSTDTYTTLQTAYYSPPTELQKASYGPHMVQLVRSGNVEGLRDALRAGLSPNPCNQFGESLIHMACRKGLVEILKVFLEFGATTQLVDDYGRTCLHDACWSASPAFDVVSVLLEHDPRMFYLKDCRGSLPLSYVHRDHLDAWQEFMNQDFFEKYYPLDGATGDAAPALCKLWPNARPAADPKNPLTCELAQMVAKGQMKPQESVILMEGPTSDDDSSDEDSEGNSDSEEDSDYDSCSSGEECSSGDEEEELFHGASEILEFARSNSSKSLGRMD